jgi:DNA repair protein RecO (recombination protein O)
MSAFYLNELLLKLLGREDPHPDVHEAYGFALAALADPAGEHRALRLFEKRLLEAIGVGLDYAHLVGDGARVEPDPYYHVDPARGITGPARGTDDPLGCRGADLLSLGGEDLATASSLAAAKRVLRAAIDAALDGRELSSRRVARAVHGLRSGKEES